MLTLLGFFGEQSYIEFEFPEFGFSPSGGIQTMPLIPSKSLSCIGCGKLPERIIQLEKKIETLKDIRKSEQLIDSVLAVVHSNEQSQANGNSNTTGKLHIAINEHVSNNEHLFMNYRTPLNMPQQHWINCSACKTCLALPNDPNYWHIRPGQRETQGNEIKQENTHHHFAT